MLSNAEVTRVDGHGMLVATNHRKAYGMTTTHDDDPGRSAPDGSSSRWREDAEAALGDVTTAVRAAWDGSREARGSALEAARSALTQLGDVIDQAGRAARDSWDDTRGADTRGAETRGAETGDADNQGGDTRGAEPREGSGTTPIVTSTPPPPADEE